MAYRDVVGYPFFRDQEETLIEEDLDDGYTCALCNTSYEKDLQLAAELGKTLLERNKELEGTIRQHQNVVDDQAQEIEYLRKQTAALREVNDSRLRIYEQLEVSIQDLEHSNHRLATQATADKKHITSLESQVEKLESKCEELERRLEERERWRDEGGGKRRGGTGNGGGGVEQGNEEPPPTREELTELRARNSRLSARLRELQATIDTVTQENMRLEEQVLILQHKQEELTVLEQVRQGEVCCRCLRSQEEISLTGDEDEASVIDSLMNDDHIKESLGDLTQLDNPYRTLVEKYEALLRVQRSPGLLRAHAAPEQKCMSLQEELQMSGEFSTFHRDEDADSETDVAACNTVGGTGVANKSTPTDFSETETSSGFSDETINKGTQTEAHVPPGAFLCSISDGDDCKFSIYDEANAIDSRFRKTPEYRRLFREIFDVLKRAAEAKDEGENLPLLEDMTPIREQAPKAPPVTPAHEDPPHIVYQDPNQAHSQKDGKASTEGPSAASKEEQSAGGEAGEEAPREEEKREQPQRRDILEHLSQGVGSSKKHRNRKQKTVEFATTLNGVIVSTRSSRRRRDGGGGWRGRGGGDSGRSTPERRNIQHQPPPTHSAWLPSTTITPAPSTASQEVAKLKQLEKSYAEVLRIGRERINRK